MRPRNSWWRDKERAEIPSHVGVILDGRPATAYGGATFLIDRTMKLSKYCKHRRKDTCILKMSKL